MRKMNIMKKLLIALALVLGLLIIVVALTFKPVALETLQDLTVAAKPPIMGAGVFIKEGIITVAHAVGESETEVWFVNNNEEFIGTVIKINTEIDLALLEVKDTHRYAYLGLNPKIGDHICVVGDPGGYEDTITFGRITHFTKEKLMVDARVSFGNSGGGVFDKKGRLLGIIHHIEPSRYKWPGDWINVAIPAKTIKAFLEE